MMRRLFRNFSITHLWRDRGGSVTIFAALSFIALFGMAAISVDTSAYYYQKRRLQSAADLSALAAASNTANSRSVILTTLANNGFDSTALENIETGGYSGDSTIASANRFVVGGSGSPAVRVTLSVVAPRYFSRIFSLLVPSAHAATQSTGTNGQTDGAASGGSTSVQVTDGITIRARAVAAVVPAASFAVGSRLLQLNGGVLNSVLGGLLGTNISLSLMDYQALASANVDLFAFSNALATRANLTAASYSDVANASVSSGDVLRSVGDVLTSTGASSGAARAVTTIANSLTGAQTIFMGSLLSFGSYGSKPLTVAPIAMTVSALDILSAVAGIANGSNQVQVNLTSALPAGLAAATLQLSIGQRPVGTSFATVGSAGASVRTAQTRLQLNVTVAGGLISLPVYIELASAVAQLSSVSCSGTTSSATLAVTPAVASASIGTVTASDITNYTVTPTPSPATLVQLLNLNLLGLQLGSVTITGKASAAISNLSATSVTFSSTDIANLTRKTVSTTDYTASLLSSLVSNLQLTTNVLGLTAGLSIPTNSAITTALTTATSPIDTLLNQILTTLGIGIGQADTWVSAVRCGQPVLVN